MPDGEVILHNNGTPRFETTNTGITVTGTAVATSFTGDLTGDVTGSISGGTVAGSTGTFTGDVSVAQNIVHTGDTDTLIEFATDTITFDTAGSERLRINSDGNVIIGTSSWSFPKALNVQGSSGSIISLYNGDTTTYAANTFAGIELKLRTGNTGNTNGTCEIRAFKENGTNGDNASGLSFYTRSNGGSPTERLRIESAGNVKIEKT